MELRKKLLGVASMAFALTLSAGFAVVGANADDGYKTDANFAITGVSVRYDDPANEKDGSGIRFKVDVPEAWTVKDAYTFVTLTPKTGKFAGQTVTATVSAEVWRPVAEGNGWNTVLVNIPETDYTTDVTAQAFVELEDGVYATEARTFSLAEAASMVMNSNNALDDRLTGYVTGVESITLDKTATSLNVGGTVTLNATVVPADYSVVWQSSNESVATVDKNGKVTGVGEGTAEITATMGGVTSTACAVTVETYFDGTFETMTAADLSVFAPTGALPSTVAIAQNPTNANGKALKVVTTAGNNPYVGINVDNDFLANVEAGKIVTYKVYAERSNTDGYMSVRFGTKTSLYLNDAQGEVVSAGQTSSNGWVELSLVLTDAQAAEIKTNKSITLFFKASAPGTPSGTYYVDDIAVNDVTFDGTFETMATSEIFKGSGYGTVSSFGVVKNPTATNGKALQVVRTGTGESVYFTLDLSNYEDFTSQAEAGKTLSFKVYAVKDTTECAEMYVRVKAQADVAGSWLAAQQEVVAASANASTDWTTIEIVLDETMANAIKTNQCLCFMLKMMQGDATGNKVGTFYFDDIIIK